MTNNSPKYVNPYRLSERTLKIWSRITFTILGIGFAGLFIMFILMAILYGDAPELPTYAVVLMIGFGVLAVGVPLLIGAIVGGISIHRLGWIPLLLVIIGLILAGLSVLDGFGVLFVYGVIGMVVGTVGITLLAKYRSNVDIWMGLPTLDSPRLYIRKNDQNKK